jgi:hypothetical protein
MEPIETKESTFVKWRLLESFLFLLHAGSWEDIGRCRIKLFMLFLYLGRTWRGREESQRVGCYGSFVREWRGKCGRCKISMWLEGGMIFVLRFLVCKGSQG